MALAISYLTANVACLAVLLWGRYYRLFPWFLAFQSLVCVQAGMRLLIATPDRQAWMRLWVPGEALLLAASVAIASESLWKSLRKVRLSRRHLVLQSYLWVCLLSFCAGWASTGSDWYDGFLAGRSALFLSLAISAFAACWFGLRYSAAWPRAARMHAALLAALFCGHVVMTDWSQWARSNLNWRLWAMLCCVGWVINCRFLAVEFASVDSRSARSDPMQSGDPRPLRRAAAPHSLRAPQADPSGLLR